MNLKPRVLCRYCNKRVSIYGHVCAVKHINNIWESNRNKRYKAKKFLEAIKR